MLTSCTICGELKNRIHVGQYGSTPIFKDEMGLRWNGKNCNKCSILKKRAYRRTKGTKDLDQIDTPHLKKGRESEHKVREFFEMLGNKVKMTNFRGPDLTIDTGSKIFTCEVKTVSLARDSFTYAVDAVCKTALNNDYIAYVYNDQIHITTMKEHLAATTKCGKRTVTNLIHDKRA